MNPSPEDVAIYRAFQKSPLFFIEKVWQLKPQPLRPEYAEIIDYVELNEIKADWFLPFEKGKHITWQQYLVFLAVERALQGRAKRKIAIESGVGVGKSSSLAMLIIWFLFTHQDAQVPCTAPTSAQMYNALWKELALWLYRMPEPLQALFDWSTEYLRVKERSNTWYARARTAAKDRPEALAGVHSDYVLCLIDEASGVIDEVFEKGEGVLAGEKVFVIMISQHTRLTGYFHDAFNSDKHNWQNLRFNSEESPIVDNQFIQRIIERDGIDSDRYRVEVLGQSPAAESVDDKGYVPLFLTTDIVENNGQGFSGTKWLGIDPAGQGGDEAVWVLRDNFHAEVLLREKKSTEMSLVQNTLALMQMHQILPQNVYVDDFGIGAKLVAGLGKRFLVLGVQHLPCHVNGVNVGDLCLDEGDRERYANTRAMLGWRIKEWLKKGATLKKNDGWKELAHIRYKANMRNRLQLMSKDEMRKLGVQSPNVYDALALTMMGKEQVVSLGVTDFESFDRHAAF